jgi:hypothetical protein
VHRMFFPVTTLILGSILIVPSNATTTRASSDPCAPVPLVHGPGATKVVPAGFAPVNASDAQLACCGFPPRPRDSRARAKWNQVMSRARHYVFPSTYVDPRTTPLTPAPGSGLSSSCPSGAHCNTKEAGFWIYGTWNSASEEWVEPAMSFNGAGQLWAIWPAIRDQAFVQAGTYQEQCCNPTTPLFFWECMGSGPHNVKDMDQQLTIAPGQLAYVVVGVDQNGYAMSFYFENVTTGVTTNFGEPNCGTNSTAPANAQFALEVNNNIGTIGWGTFGSYESYDAQVYDNSYPYYAGYITNFNPRWDVIWYNGYEIATPSNPPDAYGDYSMCNC